MHFEEIDFSRYTSIKIGPKIPVALISSPEELTPEMTLIGRGYNLLISNTPPKLAILDKEFAYLRQEHTTLIAGAATTAASLFRFAKENDIGGFEFLSKLPGSVGGLVAMNAGLKEYEIFGNLIGVLTPNGFVPKEAIPHGYRFAKLPAPILEAHFAIHRRFNPALLDLFSAMRSNQPKEPSAGSFFKNPPGDYAGRLIEAVGLKGARVGGMAFSEIHANFLVNKGGGTFDEAICLVQEATKRVFEEFGVILEPEVKIL
ncbi:MAG: UDP-N-acetylmuramate dehydrogenase [Campylobacterales bacterium]